MSRTNAPSLRDLRRPASIAPAGLFLAACLLGALALAGCKDDGPLSVKRIDPVEGDYMGGTYVRIFGNRFTRDGARSAKIYFGSRPSAPPRFASDTEMVVEAPGGKIGETVDVLIIFEPGGEKKIAQGFTYVEHKKATIDDVGTKRPDAK
jgi:IPT/TIG domain